MSLDAAKLKLPRRVDPILVSEFSCWVPRFQVNASGAIGSNMEIGLSANAATATVEGGTGITAARLLNEATGPTFNWASGYDNLKLESLPAGKILGVMFSIVHAGPRHFMRIPDYWDRHQPMRIRVIWYSNATAVGTRTITWAFIWEAVTLESAATLPTNPAGVLNPLIALDTCLGVNKTFHASPWGTLPAKSLADTVNYLHFALGCSAIGAGWAGDGSDDPFLVGLEIEYTPFLGRVHGQRGWSR